MLQVIVGKPGTGKTYHVVNQILLPHIVDWCKFEQRKGERFGRSLYTNLPLNLDFIDEELTKRYKLTVKPSSYINMIELKGKFWEKCPEGALLIFDEVHHALGSEVEGSLETDFRNYVSTHRHLHHDIILLTQHQDNVTKDILRMCEEVIELQNVKSGRIPFFSIPMSDIYNVLKVFGYYNQTYIASYGRVVGKAIKYDGRNSTFSISKKDFGFYDTHTYGESKGSSSDAPSLEMTKSGAILWIFKKHFFRCFLRVAIIAFIFFTVLDVLKKLPSMLSSAAPKVENLQTNKSSSKSKINLDVIDSKKIENSETLKDDDDIKEKIIDYFKPIAIVNNRVFSADGNKYWVGDYIEDLDTILILVDAENGFIELENSETYYIK